MKITLEPHRLIKFSAATLGRGGVSVLTANDEELVEFFHRPSGESFIVHVKNHMGMWPHSRIEEYPEKLRTLFAGTTITVSDDGSLLLNGLFKMSATERFKFFSLFDMYLIRVKIVYDYSQTVEDNKEQEIRNLKV